MGNQKKSNNSNSMKNIFYKVLNPFAKLQTIYNPNIFSNYRSLTSYALSIMIVMISYKVMR